MKQKVVIVGLDLAKSVFQMHAIGRAKLSAHLTLDLAAVYRLKLIENHPLDLRLDITNLLNRRYALNDGTGLAGGAPEWGARRGVFVGVEQGF